MRDVYVRVWNRNAKIPVKKAFYQPNRPGDDRTKLDFEADIPLWPGSNLVQVFARESNEVQSLQTVVVLKRAPDGSLSRSRPRPETPPAPPEQSFPSRAAGSFSLAPRRWSSLGPRSGERVGGRRVDARSARHDSGSRGAFQNVGVRVHWRRPGTCLGVRYGLLP